MAKKSGTGAPLRTWVELSPARWNEKRLTDALSAFDGKKILVVGDVGVDRYTEGRVERISPEAPVPILQVTGEKHKLGLAANVADNIQAVGGTPMLVGLVGTDSGGETFRKLLREVGISDRNLVTDSSRRTILKERIVSDRQQLLRVDYEDPHAISSEMDQRVLDEVERALSASDTLIIEDYAKGLLKPSLCAEIVSMARSKKKWIAADPNPRSPVSNYRGVSLLTPNTREAEQMTGMRIEDEASLFEVGNRLLELTQGESVVITRGSQGMAVFQAGRSEVIGIPTYAREVYDVSGAGDTVIAVLAMAQAVGLALEDAAVLANLAAGVEVGKRGTATVSREEILASMKFVASLC
jgi:rfaE bifunctional protein kinase chain/domain